MFKMRKKDKALRMSLMKGFILAVIFAMWAVFFFFLFPLLEDKNTSEISRFHYWNINSITVGIMFSFAFWMFAIFAESKTMYKGVPRDITIRTYFRISFLSFGYGVVTITAGNFDSLKIVTEIPQIIKSLEWTETSGEIISIEQRFNIPEHVTNVELYKRTNNGKKLFWFDIHYRYIVNGNVFESDRGQLLSKLGGTLKEAGSYERHFIPGKPVWVYFDEKNPQESILIRNYWLLFIGPLFILFGVFMLTLLLKELMRQILRRQSNQRGQSN